MAKEKFPPMIWMAVEYTKEGIAYLVAGRPRRTQDEQDACWIICELCNQFNKETKRCRKCGCFMEGKIPWKTSRCKAGKW